MIVTTYWLSGINPEPWSTGAPFRRGNRGLGIAPNPKVKAYQEAVREEFPMQNAHARIHEGELDVKFFFWRSSAHGNTADATNLMKSTEDALQGILYKNDKANLHVHSCVMEQSPATNPHVLIQVSEFVLPDIEVPSYTPSWADPEWRPPSEELF